MRKTNAAALSAAVVFALIACSPKHAIKSVSLEVHANNELTLDGKTVKSNELKNALAALAKPDTKVCVTVSPADPVPESDIEATARIVQKAGITCVGTSGVVRQ